MVQRKAPTKLGFQAADHQLVEPDSRMGGRSLKASLPPSTSSRQNQEYGRNNRRINLMKKMKKSKSRKLSDIESLGVSSLKKVKDISQPCKAPDVPSSSLRLLQTPQKRSAIRPSNNNGSPNYMKSTSSSEARKERNQVSPRRNLFASSDAAKIQSYQPKHLKNDFSSSSKSSASLRLVRTLTKAPNFKPARSSVSRCSQAALCADINAQRATCSSTLKDTEFPSYLMLSPGGTESEGTSIMKVCPYTYCSLNGHYHNPAPPLKCFLSARRRMLKTQKCTMKWEALSPRRAKKIAADEELKDNHIKQAVFPDKLSNGEDDSSSSSAISRAGSADFFIEIYAKDKEEPRDYGAFQQEMEPVDESVSDGSPQSEIDFHEQLDDNNFSDFTMMAAANSLFEEQNEQSDASFSETSDIEWEEGLLFPALDPDDEACDYSQSKSEADSSDESETPITHSYDDAVTKADETFGSSFDEIASLKGLYRDFQHEVANKNEVEVLYLNSEGYETSPEAYSQINEQRPLFGESLEMLETEQDNHGTAQGDANPVFDSASMEGQIGEIEGGNEENISDYDPNSEIIYDEDENAAQPDSENRDLISPQIICSSQNATEAIQDGIYEDNIDESLKMIQEDATAESRPDVEEEGISFETQGQASDEQFLLRDEANEDSYSKNGCGKAENSRNIEEQIVADISKCTLVEDTASEVDRTGGHDGQFDAAVACYNVDHVAISEAGNVSINAELNGNQEPAAVCNRLKGRIRCQRPVNETEDPRGFNPREPNYLPVEPCPDAEKVDLKHQMMDERKNAEEWMIDYALQRTVTKLAPAQKRKVALLVEAFETVVPIPKPVTRVRHGSVAFAHARPIQACS